ncbi:methyltransferase [Campylobacter sp. RM16190]|uniref:tRNA1(Val) (adenine(37)-N6)-methyltransferase n=1 Tax=Campylobacter sp. RM16190 TaxID=1705727 RepID=UPI001472B051|nr:methyltransferase [Campylobacter sp. RM16190]
MRLMQPKKGYRYNSDTMMLYDFVSKTKPKGKVLDVGCGCGILGLLLKRDFASINIDLLDIQEPNINLAKQNADSNSIEANFITADFSNFKSDKRYDLIVSNPPFYHDGSKRSENEHIKISRYNEFLPLENLIKSSNSLLKPHGAFVFCYDAKQLSEILICLKKYKFTPSRLCFIHPKATIEANLVMIEAKKSSKALMKILPPVFVFENDKYSEVASEIFARANTLSEDFD